MFVNMAAAIINGGVNRQVAFDRVLTRYTAEQLAHYVEEVWMQPRVNIRELLPGGSAVQLAEHEGWTVDVTPGPFNAPVPPPIGYWRHLVYAFMLEATNIEAVFRRLVYEWVTGERLPFPSTASHVWLRTTEQLFFTSPQPPSIRSLTSEIRPDRGAIRRNAYYRLLGFELPQLGGGAASTFAKADAANRDFLRGWEQLLRETWAAFENRNNGIGPNATDLVALGELVRELREMLTARRISGMLSREEFDAVGFFSWFHLTILGNTVVVTDLEADSTSPALRLKKIADFVGVPIHGKTDSYITLADAMATILELIEANMITDANIDQLYVGNGLIARSMRRIWTHWPAITGRPVKERLVAAAASRAPQPPAVRAPAPAVVPQTSRFQTLTG